MQTINITKPIEDSRAEGYILLESTMKNHIEVTSDFTVLKQTEHAADFITIQADLIANGSITVPQQDRLAHILFTRNWRYFLNDQLVIGRASITSALTESEITAAISALVLSPPFDPPIV